MRQISAYLEAQMRQISAYLEAQMRQISSSPCYHTCLLPSPPISPLSPPISPISPGYYTCLLRYQHEDFAGAAAACDAALRSGACDGSAASRYGEIWGRYGEIWGGGG